MGTANKELLDEVNQCVNDLVGESLDRIIAGCSMSGESTSETIKRCVLKSKEDSEKKCWKARKQCYEEIQKGTVSAFKLSDYLRTLAEDDSLVENIHKATLRYIEKFAAMCGKEDTLYTLRQMRLMAPDKESKRRWYRLCKAYQRTNGKAQPDPFVHEYLVDLECLRSALINMEDLSPLAPPDRWVLANSIPEPLWKEGMLMAIPAQYEDNTLEYCLRINIEKILVSTIQGLAREHVGPEGTVFSYSLVANCDREGNESQRAHWETLQDIYEKCMVGGSTFEELLAFETTVEDMLRHPAVLEFPKEQRTHKLNLR